MEAEGGWPASRHNQLSAWPANWSRPQCSALVALPTARQSTSLTRAPVRPRCHRPLSKTVRFNVLRVIPAGSGAKKGFGSF